MAGQVNIVPAVAVPDDPDGVLDYLQRRTSDTIGVQADRADAVVVGVVSAVGAYNSMVRDEDLRRVQPWLSGEAGPAQVRVHSATIEVEEWLLGPSSTSGVQVAWVSGRGPSAAGPVPLLHTAERRILFLRRPPGDLPYAPYLEPGSFQLAQGSNAVCDGPTEIAHCANAVRWYAALPKDDEEGLYASLVAALSAANPHIVRYAIRRLAQLARPGTAERFRSIRPGADESLRTRLMLGFHVLGERDEACRLLEEAYRSAGKESWLSQWGLRRSHTEEGRDTGMLSGPDPNEVKGD